MSPSEMSDLGGFPTLQAVPFRHRFDDPHVDRECLESTSAEEENAVRNFLADAGQLAESFFRHRIGQLLRLLQPSWVRCDKLGGLVNVACAKSQQTRA